VLKAEGARDLRLNLGSNAFGVGVPAPVDYDEASHAVVDRLRHYWFAPNETGWTRAVDLA